MSQRLSREAGWYPDAIGNADAFRWWDGTQWTAAVADTLWAPEPENPQPYHRPQQPVVPAPVAPRVVELEDEPPPYRKPLLIGAMSMVLAAGLFTGGVWLFGTGGGDDPAGQSEAGTAQDRQDHSASRARSEPGASPDGERDREKDPDSDQQTDTAKGAGLPVFPEPGEDWVTGHGVVPHSQVRRLITEKQYNGEDDWGAIIVSGELPQGVTRAEELSRTAKDVGEWFGEVAFGVDRSPSIEVVQEGPTLLAQRPAYQIEFEIDYEIEGLKADRDRTTVAVVDLGPKTRPGVFISSVPDTHPELEKVADRALSRTTLSSSESTD